ncbi:unnamed protein product [Hermetia illucens]|uniref:PDZ domain-containing protein n=1 Tax=Hermetia illucens TaxID=343691 RepID=A0A7R8UUC5_HERIL|nr:unnamed protein product [Hermetia illucens]
MIDFYYQVVELNGYVIILVESRDGKIKLYGSPADKDNLEVGDEILDINERKLEDLNRAEVIRHIHECIQSCMVKLRVKRRSDSVRLGKYLNKSSILLKLCFVQSKEREGAVLIFKSW